MQALPVPVSCAALFRVAAAAAAAAEGMSLPARCVFDSAFSHKTTRHG